jgi:GMP synthase (glutamine-hydrolysing)
MMKIEASETNSRCDYEHSTDTSELIKTLSERRLRVHCLQHVPFEGLGCIEPWLRSRSASLTFTKLYQDVQLPRMKDIDWLIVTGGPMSVYDEWAYPWLVPEKHFIADAIACSKVVLGICLGAQLIACSLGSEVSKQTEKEMGWFPIELTNESSQSSFTPFLDDSLDVFHWHCESFEPPPDSIHLARSEACEHQAFSMGDRVLGLQFHLEVTPEATLDLINNCEDELTAGTWIQARDDMLLNPARFERANSVMTSLLAYMETLAV